MTFHRRNLSLMLFCTVITFACKNPFFPPSFTVPIDIVNADIQEVIKTTGIYIEGQKLPFDDKVHTSLTVQLINAKDIQVNKDSLLRIQRKVASKVKGRLKDPLQYDRFYIIFIRRDTTKVLNSTRTSEKGLFPHSFKATEL
jgi:hypothetical protein